MSGYAVAVLGATGVVGRQMLEVLQERNFPVERLVPLASARSAGKTIPFAGQDIPVQEATEGSFAGMDLVLGAVSADQARRFAPAIRAAGAVFVDNSSAFRLDPRVPLVVPEVNGEDVAWHRGLLSNPNCSTIITLTAVNPLLTLGRLKSMVVSTYQAVSGAGAAGLAQLEAELSGAEFVPGAFPYPIAGNLIPMIGGPDEAGYTSEEMKMQREGRRLLHLPELRVSCTCVRVPVERSHSISVRLEFDRPVEVEQARASIAAGPGCRLVDDPAGGQYPMPLDASGQDLVLVGRIRKDLTSENGLCLWCCGDQVRKGAATNAVQIAQEAHRLGRLGR